MMIWAIITKPYKFIYNPFKYNKKLKGKNVFKVLPLLIILERPLSIKEIIKKLYNIMNYALKLKRDSME